jgi:hypothetical protein
MLAPFRCYQIVLEQPGPRDAQRDKLRHREKKELAIEAVTRKKNKIDDNQCKRSAQVEIIGEMHAYRLEIPVYAVAWRAKPKEATKVVGRPWSVIVSVGASAGEALRARRSCHERR